MTLYSEIPAAHWQQKVQPGPLAAWDEIEVGIDDLAQAIALICLTPKGSVPTEPTKCCDALGFIDRPEPIAVPMITREIWDAVSLWEPRVELLEVEVKALDFHHFEAHIHWRPKEQVLHEIQTTRVTLSGGADG